LNIKILKLDENAVMPKYQTTGSAGFDLHSIENINIPIGQRRVIRTGLSFEIESGYEVQIRSRSGLAYNNGIAVLNSPGTIDSDYRGEIKIILINQGEDNFIIKIGDRIAQGVVSKVYQANFEIVNNLGETDRGTKGFGSTGV
jgi:dUTP pyrophosphatase